MTIATLAHGARQSLARGLEALQAIDAPPGLLDVAQPVARAMGMLMELERTPDALTASRVEPALEALRESLRLLQRPEHLEHPAAERGMAAVAETLGVVVELARSLEVQSRPEPPPSSSGWRDPARVQAAALVARTSSLDPRVPTLAPARRDRARPPAIEVARIEPSRIEPMPLEPAPRETPRVERARSELLRVRVEAASLPAVVPTLAPGRNDPPRGAARFEPPRTGALRPPPAADDIEPAPSTRVSNTRPPAAPGEPPVALSPPAVAPTRAALAKPRETNVSARDESSGVLERPIAHDSEPRLIEAPLGANSPSNFYAGLSSDVLASGGLFVATYQLPEVGEAVLLEISMPGGYEFTAKAIVTWIRSAGAAATGTQSLRATAGPPGFGARFSEISEEGRSLVLRYVRNREPLFYDDP
jgi:hypothetical protein